MIDHDPSGAERIQRPLADAGYDVVVSSDAGEAMSTFEKTRPDLAVIEALLPEKPGPVLCQEIKDSPAGRTTPVVLLLESDEDKQARARSLDLHGCDLLIDRSIAEDELIELFEQLLRTRPARGGEGNDAPETSRVPVPVKAEPKAARSAVETKTDSSGTLIDSDGVNDALSRLDAIIDEQKGPRGAQAAQADAQEADAPCDEERVRRAERAGDFSFLSAEAGETKPASPARTELGPESEAGTETPRSAEDAGQDIADHIDALFAATAPGEPTPAEKQVLSWTFENGAAARQREKPSSAASGPAPAKPADEPRSVESPPTAAPAATLPSRQEAERPVRSAKQKPAPEAAPAARTTTASAMQTSTFAGPASRRVEQAPPRAESGSRWWVVAACLSIVLIGGGLAILFLGGKGAVPATVQPPPAPSAPVASVFRPAEPAPLEEPGGTTEPGETAETGVTTGQEQEAIAVAAPETTLPATRGSAPAPEAAPAAAAPAQSPRKEPAKSPVREARATAPQAPRRTEIAAPPQARTPEETRSRTEAAPRTALPAPQARPAPAVETAADAPAPVESPQRAEAEPPAPEATPVTSAAPPAPSKPVLEPPQLLERSEPDYPPKSLKRAGGERIVLKLLIGDNGRIARVLVEQGTRFKDLEAAAVSAVLRWKYRPATENGVPVEAWTSAEFTF